MKYIFLFYFIFKESERYISTLYFNTRLLLSDTLKEECTELMFSKKKNLRILMLKFEPLVSQLFYDTIFCINM